MPEVAPVVRGLGFAKPRAVLPPFFSHPVAAETGMHRPQAGRLSSQKVNLVPGTTFLVKRFPE